ncbi:MAG: monovalent cation/H+ antiporter subunit D family protein [Betaproteobacteria bacterium]|nr:monovalent cation/H+ antiporter subunit D family protein [Betaproteobacteria bacterium]
MARSGFLGWVASLAASAAAFAMSVALLVATTESGAISYAIGSWPPPWGIEYRVDAANALVALLVSAIALVVLPYARRSVSAEIGQERLYLFYALLMLCLAGLLGIAVTGDAFNLFVFLEISSLATYVLIALGRNRRALTAAYQYLILGTIGATLYVTGVGLLYLATGTLNLADMAARLADVPDKRPLVAGLAFITAGVGLKLALFPLHAWLPNAYAYAPSAVSAFLAATATKVAVYVLMRVYFSVYGVDAVFRDMPLGPVLAVLSVAALFIASAAAIVQKDLKRLLAYSSVAQIGYITLGISLGSAPGLTAAVAHLVNHGITKGALFLLAGAIALRAGGTGFDRVAGLGRTMPLTAFAFVLGGLSLIGVPGTAGFASKWALVAAAIGAGHWWIAAAVLLSSLLAVAYVWKFVECAYFRGPPGDAPDPGEAPADMTIPAFALTAAVIAAGLFAWPVLEASARAAEALMGAPR